MTVIVPVAWMLVGASLMLLSVVLLLRAWLTDRAEKSADRELDKDRKPHVDSSLLLHLRQYGNGEWVAVVQRPGHFPVYSEHTHVMVDGRVTGQRRHSTREAALEAGRLALREAKEAERSKRVIATEVVGEEEVASRDLMRCGVSGIAVGGRPAPVCCLGPGHAGKHKAYEPTVGVIDWEVSDGR